MSQAPVMPLWTDALIADTTHLSPREFGCYLLLLIATWRNNGQPFADNDKVLARICRMPTFEWKSQIRKTLEPFFNLADGHWRQKRLEKEWTFCSARARTSRNNGRMGGRPSRDKPLETNGSENPAGYSQDNPEETQKKPALIHNLEEDTDVEGKPSTSPSRQALRTRQINRDFEEAYRLYPKHEAKGAAQKAYVKARQSADAQTLRAGIERYADKRRGEDPQYTAQMSTWLNQQRWLDGEPTSPNGGAHAGYDGPTGPPPKPEDLWPSNDPPLRH